MKMIKISLLALMLISTFSFADCPAPAIPTIPDGSKATMEEMLNAKAAIGRFQADLGGYRECIDKFVTELDINIATATSAEEVANGQAIKASLNQAYNQSVSVEEELAKQFNTAIKAYKKANPN